MLPRLKRRRFLEAMGLASASPLLLGIGDQLIGRALGATSTRKIGIFFAHGETFTLMPKYTFVPDEVTADFVGKAAPVDMQYKTWPTFLEKLAPFKDRMVIVDGLTMDVGKPQANHGDAFALFSGRPPLDNFNPMHGRVPADITLDQVAVQAIGQDTAMPSILIGMGGNSAETHASCFAAGREKPLAQVQRPGLLLSRLVGQKATAMVPGGSANPAITDKKLLDLLRDDIKRMNAGLAGEERSTLDGYLQSIDTYDKKQERLRQAFSLPSCKDMPTAADGDSETRLDGLFRLTSLALRCGITNVVGITVGNSIDVHDDLACFKKWFNNGMGGHQSDAELYNSWMQILFHNTTGLLAQMLLDLGPLLDNTFFLLTPSNHTTTGAGHHGDGNHGVGFVFDGTRKLKTGGRYWRGPGPYLQQRRMVDLYTNLTHVMGAPQDKFNGLGKGPIMELFA